MDFAALAYERDVIRGAFMRKKFGAFVAIFPMLALVPERQLEQNQAEFQRQKKELDGLNKAQSGEC
jgi:DNA-directed RNA polymerase subunit E'/Rpb7